MHVTSAQRLGCTAAEVIDGTIQTALFAGLSATPNTVFTAGQAFAGRRVLPVQAAH